MIKPNTTPNLESWIARRKEQLLWPRMGSKGFWKKNWGNTFIIRRIYVRYYFLKINIIRLYE